VDEDEPRPRGERLEDRELLGTDEFSSMAKEDLGALRRAVEPL